MSLQPVIIRFYALFFCFFILPLVSCSGGTAGTGSSANFAGGTIDTTFGSNGIVTTTIRTYSGAKDAIIQPDGKIIVLAYSSDDASSTSSFVLLRYTTDGVLDPTFGNGGIVYGSYSSASSLAYQNDGKIIIVGDYYNGTDSDIFIMRYNSDGTPDQEFRSDGIVSVLSSNNETGGKVAIQSSGKIIIAGTKYADGKSVPFLVRLDSNGFLDTGFGINSVVQTSIDSNSTLAALKIDRDGTILIALKLYSSDFHSSGFAILKYDSDGHLNTGFGNGGTVTDSLGARSVLLSDLTLQSDGKIVALVSIDNLYYGGVIISSFTFSKPTIPAKAEAESSGLSPWTDTSTWSGFALVRYNTNGTRDNEMGENGAAMYTAGSSGVSAERIAVQEDGTFTIVGQDWNITAGFAVMHLNSNGSIDTGFGTNGMVTTSVGDTGGGAQALILQSDDKIVAAGRGIGQDSSNLVLIRYYQ